MKISTNLPLDESFPLWKHLPRSLHKRDKGNFDVRPACAYCAWKYKKFATLPIKYNDLLKDSFKEITFVLLL